MDSPSPEDWPRITDLSFLDAEDIKYRNTHFLDDDDHPYDPGFDQPYSEVRKDIWRVRNHKLREVLRRFPTDEPLTEQCALWMHGVAGIHFFPDANHRTALALLRKILGENQISYKLWSLESLRSTREVSHDVRSEIEDVELDTLYREDELYEVWLDFFSEELDVWVYDAE